MNLSKAERAYACFGIGNSYYRMNKPGLAALNYRRALELSPYFTEAEYNLQFIERKEGAILPANTTENQWLTYIRHDTLGPISILSGAVMLTFLALLTVTRRHGALLTILATLSGLVTVAAVMNYIMYPETPESIPADRLLVVTQKTPGRHAADMNSPALITLPESTPLILRAERGSWYYATHLPEHARLVYPGRTLSRCSALLSCPSPLEPPLRNAVFPEGRLSFSRIQSSSLLKKPEPENGTSSVQGEKPGSTPSGNVSEDSPAA